MRQGRTLGGGSSVNAMVYIRGQKEDYDGWRDLGCPGWGYEDVLPFFRKAEGNGTLSGRYHGAEGPLRSTICVTPPGERSFIRETQEVGETQNRPIPYNYDFNGESQEGSAFTR